MDDIRDRFRAAQPQNNGRRDFLGPMQPPRPQEPARTPQSPQKPSNGPSSWMKPQVAPQPKPVPQPSQQRRSAEPQQHGPIPQRSAVPIPRKRKTKSRKKPVLAVIAILVLLAGGGGAYAFLGQSSSDEQASLAPAADTAGASTAAANQAPELPEGTIKLIATGTFSAYDSVNINAKNGSDYDYLPLMNKLKPVFDSADISVCHQETLAGGADKGISGYPEFNAPFEWSEGMVGLGCNVMNMASFNTNDKGQAAISAAVKFFDDQKSVLAVAGANRNQAEQDKIRYFETKGLKFAFLSYTTQSQKPPAEKYGVNMWNEATATKQIEAAQKEADFVIVGMTWGDPDKAPVTTQQKQIAQFLAKLDVDLVLGNGSHILQPAVVLEGTEGHQTLVWYSLGNAVNSQLPLENLVGGIAVIEIDIRTQDMINPRLLPVYQHYEWTAAEKANSNYNARKNLSLYMLDQATEALSKSQHNTTVDAQTKRVKDIITSQAPIKVITSKDLE